MAKVPVDWHCDVELPKLPVDADLWWHELGTTGGGPFGLSGGCRRRCSDFFSGVVGILFFSRSELLLLFVVKVSSPLEVDVFSSDICPPVFVLRGQVIQDILDCANDDTATEWGLSGGGGGAGFLAGIGFFGVASLFQRDTKIKLN